MKHEHCCLLNWKRRHTARDLNTTQKVVRTSLMKKKKLAQRTSFDAFKSRNNLKEQEIDWFLSLAKWERRRLFLNASPCTGRRSIVADNNNEHIETNCLANRKDFSKSRQHWRQWKLIGQNRTHCGETSSLIKVKNKRKNSTNQIKRMFASTTRACRDACKLQIKKGSRTNNNNFFD